MSIQVDPFAARARLAWIILLGSFTVFSAICLSVPFITNAVLQNTTQPLTISVGTSKGTVAIDQLANGNNMTALPPEAEPIEIAAHSEILTNAADSASMLVFSPETDLLLMRAQIYGNTSVEIERAVAPRFRISSAEQEMELMLRSGRMHITLLPIDGRAFALTMHTPQGRVHFLAPGQYSLEVNNEQTQLAVQNGEALLASESTADFVVLQTDQRGVLGIDGQPVGPLDTERNLIENGDFIADFSSWIITDWNIDLEGQPSGETRVVEVAGEPTLRFTRVGVGHADAVVRQILAQDVTDFQSLRLQITLKISQQTLGVCGQVGSECPLTLEIEYEDINGNRQVWRQGFYSTGSIAQDTPDTCVTCRPPYNSHIYVIPGRLISYEVDLLESLSLQGQPLPRALNSISIIAAGHGFETEVADIALLAKE